MMLAIFNYLGQPVEDNDLTDDQRAILSATEQEIGVELALGSGIPGDIAAMLDEMTRRGWWVEIKTPFQPTMSGGELYWVGATPLGTTGWNGRPDIQVGDASLCGALWRVVLLALHMAKAN